MTVINLGYVGYPRSGEMVTTPQYLLSPAMIPSSGIGKSDVTRAGYDQWKQSQGLAGITVGKTTVSNTQIGVTIAGAIAGYFAGKQYLGKSDYSAYITALVGALVAYWLGNKYLK